MNETGQASSWHAFSTIWRRFTLSVKDYTQETVEHLILGAALYLITCVCLYFALTRWRSPRQPPVTSKPQRILIVTAHPDDECMFFGPTIVNHLKKGAQIYLMCLSTGQNYGMGVTRKAELYESCKILGLEEGRISVYNHTNLPDELGARWPIELVSHLILNQVESLEINSVITFDKHGVSYHLNHCSIYYAIANLILDKKLPPGCTVYVLETVNVLRKYCLFLDVPISYLISRIRILVSFQDRTLIIRAMKKHQSQMLWFRYLYVTFSRYLLINTLQKMELSDVELDLELDD